MKKRNHTILILVLIMFVISLFLVMNNSSTTLSRKDKDFAVSDTASITKYFMADKDGRQIIVQRKEEGGWVVNDTYIANKPAVDLMLRTFANVKVLQPVARAAHNNVVKRMAAIGVKVEIYQTVYRINLFHRIKLFPREKLTKVYYVGDNTQDNMGTYMLIDGSKVPFITYLPGFRGFIASRYTTKVEDWRDHTIFNFRINEMKAVKVELPKNRDFSFVFNNLGQGNIELRFLHDDRLVDVYDTLKALDFLSAFNDIKFEAVITALDSNTRDSILNSVPDYIITVETFESGDFTIDAFRRKAPKGSVDLYDNPMIWDLDRLYVFMRFSEDLTVCQYFVFDRILRNIEYFLPGSKERLIVY